MKVGDLVKLRSDGWNVEITDMLKSDWRTSIGLIISVLYSKEKIPDYRSQDSMFILWHDRTEWLWRSDLEAINDSR